MTGINSIRSVRHGGRTYFHLYDLSRITSNSKSNTLYVPMLRLKNRGIITDDEIVKDGLSWYLTVSAIKKLAVRVRKQRREKLKNFLRWVEETYYNGDDIESNEGIVHATPIARLLSEINSLTAERRRLKDRLAKINARLSELVTALGNLTEDKNGSNEQDLA